MKGTYENIKVLVGNNGQKYFDCIGYSVRVENTWALFFTTSDDKLAVNVTGDVFTAKKNIGMEYIEKLNDFDSEDELIKFIFDNFE